MAFVDFTKYGRGSGSLGLGRPQGVGKIVDCGHSFNSLGSVRLGTTRDLKVHPLASHRRTRQVGKGLMRVGGGSYCAISSLARSVPFLMPHTDSLLGAVKDGFLSSLATGKLGPGRVIVASILHARSSMGHLEHEGVGTSGGSTRFCKAAFSID